MLFADIQSLLDLLRTLGHFWVDLHRKTFLFGLFYLRRVPSLCFTDLPCQLFELYIQFFEYLIIFLFFLLDEHVRPFEVVDLLCAGDFLIDFSEFVAFIVYL